KPETVAAEATPTAPRPLARIVPHPAAATQPAIVSTPPRTAPLPDFLSPRLRAKLDEEEARERSAMPWLGGLAAIALLAIAAVLATRLGVPLPWNVHRAPAAAQHAGPAPAAPKPAATNPPAIADADSRTPSVHAPASSTPSIDTRAGTGHVSDALAHA